MVGQYDVSISTYGELDNIGRAKGGVTRRDGTVFPFTDG
jgi:hypothetical protein